VLVTRIALAAAVLVGSWSAAVLAQSQAQIEKSEEGKKLMAAGKFEQAIPVYRQLSQSVPNNPGMLLNLGMALHLAGHSRQAIPPLQSAIKLDAGIAPAWLFLGEAYLGAGEPARAVQPLKKYVGLQPEDPGGHQTLGDALLATDAFREAVVEYKKLAELEANNPRAWYGLNRSYSALAESAFRVLEKTAPESGWWLALVADERVVRRQFRSAFFFYRRAEALQPNLPGLHLAIANVYRETGHADWVETEQKKEAQSPDCATMPLACDFASGRYAELLQRAGQTAAPEAYWDSRASAQLAREAFARLEHLPEGAEVHELRADLMRVRRQNLEAIKEWRMALNYAPQDEHLREGLLASLYQARDYAAALPLAEELIRENPRSAELNLTKGDILLSSQEAEKAIPFLKAAAKSDPKLLAAHHALGRAYMQVGQPSAAIPHLEAALPIDEDGSLRYQLARAYQATGQAEAAKKTLEEYQQRQKADREDKSKLEEELKITPP
jgi:predicted Zn-dependent protease